MSKNKNLASSIIQLVGGKENIADLFHCMTRLRVNVKDMGLAKLDEVKKVEGVMGVQVTSGEIQIIVGPGVETVYNEVVSLVGLTKNKAIDENLDPGLPKPKRTLKWIINEIFNVFSACMSPLVPLFVVLGIFNMIAVLIGPNFFKLVTEESDLYKNFYFVFKAILYFLPILVAYTASRRFGSNTLITIALASILLYPELIAIVTTGTKFTVFGFNMPLVNYSQSIIPIILIAWIQSYVERFLNKYCPEIIKVIVIPVGTIMVMMPLGLLVLGPLGTIIGTSLAGAVFWLHKTAGPLQTTLYGAVAIITLATGISRPIFFVALASFFATGVEYAIMPIAMVITNWVVLGAVLGYIIKVKSAKDKQFGITCFASLFLGGVSEPSIFGILFNHKKTLIYTALAGALAGLYVGVMQVGYYAFGPSSFLNVIGFIGGGSNANFIHGCIASAIGFFTALVLMVFMFKEEK
jgi:beta-glucoside PTS system EIICBA component